MRSSQKLKYTIQKEDEVREVKFNPIKKYLFAVGYGKGNVGIYDMRKMCRLVSENNSHIG